MVAPFLRRTAGVYGSEETLATTCEEWPSPRIASASGVTSKCHAVLALGEGVVEIFLPRSFMHASISVAQREQSIGGGR
jgi:hypothetical protein